MQHSLRWELMLHDFELGLYAVKAAKNFYCTKSEGTVEHHTVIRGFKKFCSVCKTRSVMPKTVDAETVLLWFLCLMAYQPL